MLIRDCNKMFRKEPHEICGRQSFLNIFPHLLQKKNILEIFLEIFQRFTKSICENDSGSLVTTHLKKRVT